VNRCSTAATLRRYRAEWKAALARRDYAKTRTILDAALSAVSSESAEDLDTETGALHGLLALDRRLRAIVEGEAPARLPPAERAFSGPSTRRFLDPWLRAIAERDYVLASSVLRDAIAAASRQLSKRARSQQALISRLKRLQRTPLEYRAIPDRCACCGGTTQAGVDSGRLFMCADCIQQAHEIVTEQTGTSRAR